MGRPSKPAEEQELKGNPGHRTPAVAPTDVLPHAGIEPPEWLSEKAAAVWRRAAPDLAHANILRSTDVEVFAMYCQAVSEFWSAVETVNAEGVTYETTSPFATIKRIHPAYAVLRDARREATRIAAQFGMTPAARASIFAHFARQAGRKLGDPEDPKPKTPPEDDTAPMFDDDDVPVLGALN